MLDIEVKDDEEETEISMIMHMDEYVGGEKVDLQARLWNQFVRPKYIENLCRTILNILMKLCINLWQINDNSTKFL